MDDPFYFLIFALNQQNDLAFVVEIPAFFVIGIKTEFARSVHGYKTAGNIHHREGLFVIHVNGSHQGIPVGLFGAFEVAVEIADESIEISLPTFIGVRRHASINPVGNNFRPKRILLPLNHLDAAFIPWPAGANRHFSELTDF